MFDQKGLSLDQAPPISVIFGLFMLGAFFGIVSSAAVLLFGVSIFDPSSTGAIVMVHLLALGVMMSFMMGALFQMLPVVTGVVLQDPIPKANMLKVLLTTGVLSLIAGFVFKVWFLFLFAAIFLGSGLLYIWAQMASRLARLSNHSASSRGMLFALIHMGVLVSLALYLTFSYANMIDGGYFLPIKQMHYSYALFGWIALLISSISFQTIEMFYVTPPYPKWFSQNVPIAVFVLLGIVSVSLAIKSNLSTVSLILIYLIFGIYGVLTLIRLSRRKRPLADATVWFWRIGMSSLILSMAVLIVNTFVNMSTLLDISVVLFASFALSVVWAMFYKIVPFLTWFHLNAQGYLTAPMMHEVIHPKTAKKHLWVHIGAITAFLLAIYFPSVIYLAGVLLSITFGWTLYQIIHAGKLYKHTQKTGKKFEFGV